MIGHRNYLMKSLPKSTLNGNSRPMWMAYAPSLRFL